MSSTSSKCACGSELQAAAGETATCARCDFARERKWRRLTAAIAVLSVGLLVLVAGWSVHQQTQANYIALTTAQINQELGRARAVREQARAIVMTDAATRDSSARLWTDALASANQANSLLQTAPSDELTRQAVADIVRAMQAEAEQAAGDRQMLKRLEAARDQRLTSANEDGRAAGDAYAAAFREYEIDVLALPATEAGEKIRASRLPAQLAVALDDWLILTMDQPLAHKLVETANASDPDPFRSRLREARARQDDETLAKLFAESSQQELSVPVTLLLSNGLQRTNRHAESIRVLERAKERYPDDFWINCTLGGQLLDTDPSRAEEGGRCLAMAAARRPDLYFVHFQMANNLAWRGNFRQAAAEYESTLRLQPDFVPAKVQLSRTLFELGEFERYEALNEELAQQQSNNSVAIAALANCRVWQRRELEALELARGLVTAHPHLAHSHACLGDILFNLGQLEPAAESYRAALAIQPDMRSAQIGLTNTLVQLQQLDAAEKALQPALDAHEKVPEVHLSHAQLLFAQKKSYAGLEAMARAVNLCPGYWKLHGEYGDRLLANKQPDRAIVAYSRALELKPTAHLAVFGLGECCRIKGEHADAAAHFQRAIDLDPKRAQYHHSRGFALFDQGLFDQALPAFEQALILEPENPERTFTVGLALHRMRHYQDALLHLRRAAELLPQRADVRNILGEALQQAGDVEAAIAVFHEATEVDSGVATAWSNLGAAHVQRRELGPAAEAFRRAAEIEPKNASNFAALGSVLRRQGKSEAAIAELGRAVQLQPGNARIHAELGLTYQEAGRVEEALGAFRQALWLDPENPGAYLNCGISYLLQGRLDEALTAFERARQSKQPPPLSGLLLGKTLVHQGEFRRAQLTLGVVSLQSVSGPPTADRMMTDLVDRCTALLALEPRKDEIVRGAYVPPSAADTLNCALFCTFTRHDSPAVAYFQRAFAVQPEFLDEEEVPLIAARTAIKAAAGAANAAESARLRGLGLEWAEEALAGYQQNQLAWSNKYTLIGGMPNVWRHHPDFAGVNNPAARANLPIAERAGWETFWDEADAFRSSAAP